MDSCLVLTECFSCQILRLRTSAVDLIHSERVSTSTSSFFAHRLAYSSHKSMIMPKFWYHEYESGSLYFGFLLKRFLSLILRTKLRSPVTIWPHGAYRNCESQQLGDPWKDFESRFAANLLCNWIFWSGIAIGIAWRLLVLKVRRYMYFILDALPIQNVAKKSIFQAPMALLANFTFKNGRFLVSAGSSTLTALTSLFEEIAKIIPCSKCPGYR